MLQLAVKLQQSALPLLGPSSSLPAHLAFGLKEVGGVAVEDEVVHELLDLLPDESAGDGCEHEVGGVVVDGRHFRGHVCQCLGSSTNNNVMPLLTAFPSWLTGQERGGSA